MKKRIAVVGGGYSGEYEISVLSAETVCNNLPSDLYEVYPVQITRDGWTAKLEGEEIAINRNDFSIPTAHGKITFDCVFVAIHGSPGEDGKLQGYFDMIGMPYTTGNTDNLALTFNKMSCLAVLRSRGFRAAKGLIIKAGETVDVTGIGNALGYPCFVKPANGGSSLGASKVSRKEDLEMAVSKAFREDNHVLVEEYLDGTELTCGVSVIDGVLTALPISEVATENDFFDFEAKYVGSKTEEITPARISTEETTLVQETAKSIYQVLGCRGPIRIDFFLIAGQVYVIEVNTVPGMSPKSFLPQQAEAAGIPLSRIFHSAIEQALRGR